MTRLQHVVVPACTSRTGQSRDPTNAAHWLWKQTVSRLTDCTEKWAFNVIFSCFPLTSYFSDFGLIKIQDAFQKGNWRLERGPCFTSLWRGVGPLSLVTHLPSTWILKSDTLNLETLPYPLAFLFSVALDFDLLIFMFMPPSWIQIILGLLLGYLNSSLISCPVSSFSPENISYVLFSFPFFSNLSLLCEIQTPLLEPSSFTAPIYQLSFLSFESVPSVQSFLQFFHIIFSLFVPVLYKGLTYVKYSPCFWLPIHCPPYSQKAFAKCCLPESLS